MIKYKKKNIETYEVESITCDVCKKEYDYTDIMETQEFHRINFDGGYGSVFGDGVTVEYDICQYCLHRIIKDYMMVE